MNRKGYISITWIFIIMMVIMGLAMAQSGIDISKTKEALDKLNWSVIGKNVSDSLQLSINNAPNEYTKEIISIAGKGIDFFGYTLFAVGKLAAKVAMDNPNIMNAKVLFGLLILSLIAPLLFPLFTIIISIYLIIKEWWLVRKEKKSLEALRGQ